MRKLLDASRVTVLFTAILCTSGCVGAKWPAIDYEHSRLVMVAGNFSGVRHLDEPPCMMKEIPLDDGIVFDCFSGPPSRSTFHVYEVVFGSLADRHPSVAYHSSILNSNVPPGAGNPMLALMYTDGRHVVLGNGAREIAQTVDGEWAMPVYANIQLDIMPCGAVPLVRPLKFANPQPSQSLEGLDGKWIEELRQNPRVRMEEGRFYVTHGIPLRDIRQFMATVNVPDSYYCDDYES